MEDMEDMDARAVHTKNAGGAKAFAGSSGFNQSRRMLQTSSPVSCRLQLLLDITVVLGMLFLLFYLFKDSDGLEIYHELILLVPVLMWIIYSHDGLYRRFPGHTSRSVAVLWAWTKVVGVLVFLAFMSKTSGLYSRQIIISWFVSAAVIQVLLHIAMEHLIRAYKASHQEIIPSILVGNCAMGRHLADHINQNPWMPQKIVGVISDKEDGEEWFLGGLPKLGGLDELREIVEKYNVRRVYFALPMKTGHQVRELQLELIDLNVDIVWAPDIFGLHMISPSVREIAGVPLYYLSESPLVEGARLSKMLMDKSLAIIALFLLSPIMLMIVWGVKWTSPGPVLFRQERHGLDGKIIKVMKFRSMKVHDESRGVVTQATRNDSRVTPFGAFLRRSSLDELPQLFNVLRGDMSLVGPRPHAKAHNDFYADKIEAYMSRHRIVPGITGLAQVNGFRGETDTLEKMEKRVEYDLAYINNWSIWLDIRIMIKTVYTLFSKNAY